MKDIRSDLKAYLDKELPSERMEEVRLALEQDAELREEAEFYQLLTRSILAAAKTPEVIGMDKAVSETIKNSEKKGFSFPKFSLSRRTWQVAGAVAVFGVFVVIFSPILFQAKSAAKFSPTASAPAYAETFERSKSDAFQEAVPAESLDKSTAGEAEFKAPSRQAPSSSPSVGGLDLREGLQGRNRADAKSPIAPPVLQSNRLINRAADMTVRVKEVGKAAVEAERIAQRYGGFTESSNVNSDPQNPTASLSLRVASQHWAAATQAFRSLGIVLNESSSGEDVTAQVVDLEARVKTLRAEEESLRIILSKAYRLGDILQVKDRISQVRMEIESMTGQAKQLRNLAALSTVTLTLTQDPKVNDEPQPDPWMEDSWTNAVNALQSVLKTVGSFMTYVVVFAPLWLPVMLVAWLIARKAGKSG